jgi:ribosome-associated heat shock protein Hsp15
MTAGDAATLRLDKFLWFARLARTRSLAARLCAAGAVAIAGRPILKPGHPVRVGDVLTAPQGRLIRTIRIVALASRRGPAAEAQALYAELTPPRRAAADAAWTRLLDDADDGEAILQERAG